ncbi:hypothetical protein BDA96_04G060500 [Sorghum bicolor]|uniref:Uncharacterized protein n=2 Tax=Sorghum bicolor TaxID=4558 RepID=A0A921UH25_SORBI|nr:hypothetical protein BDA96_04G060500 [Sorghum bicolor]KXG29559.1 hypothetical protein SORBI_3004G055300 [Sorghum bicolor]
MVPSFIGTAYIHYLADFFFFFLVLGRSYWGVSPECSCLSQNQNLLLVFSFFQINSQLKNIVLIFGGHRFLFQMTRSSPMIMNER